MKVDRAGWRRAHKVLSCLSFELEKCLRAREPGREGECPRQTNVARHSSALAKCNARPCSRAYSPLASSRHDAPLCWPSLSRLCSRSIQAPLRSLTRTRAAISSNEIWVHHLKPMRLPRAARSHGRVRSLGLGPPSARANVLLLILPRARRRPRGRAGFELASQRARSVKATSKLNCAGQQSSGWPAGPDCV